jgi:hypothetical protein
LRSGGTSEYFGFVAHITVECGTSVWAYAHYDDFPSHLWTDSRTELVPVQF